MSEFKDLGLSYESALHGVQSAIAFEYERENPQQDMRRIRKHLRVGIDSAHSSHAALADLLIKKGIISRDEYKEHVRLLMNHELHLYETRLSKQFGAILIFH
jgi:hypothetical protein